MNISEYKARPGSLPAMGMLLAVMILVVSTPLHADKTQLPSYYPDTFQATGIITDPRNNNSVIISGRAYGYGITTKIHSLHSKTGSLYELGMGTEVGFNYTEDDKHRRYLVEAWILPKGTHKGDL